MMTAYWFELRGWMSVAYFSFSSTKALWKFSTLLSSWLGLSCWTDWPLSRPSVGRSPRRRILLQSLASELPRRKSLRLPTANTVSSIFSGKIVGCWAPRSPGVGWVGGTWTAGGVIPERDDDVGCGGGMGAPEPWFTGVSNSSLGRFCGRSICTTWPSGEMWKNWARPANPVPGPPGITIMLPTAVVNAEAPPNPPPPGVEMKGGTGTPGGGKDLKGGGAGHGKQYPGGPGGPGKPLGPWMKGRFGG